MSIKKFILICLLMTSGFAHAQRTLSSEIGTAGNAPEDCPPGYCPTLHINLEIFNFHKPRTNCSSGFGLCCRLSSTVSCQPCFQKSVFDGHFMSCAALVTERTLELRVPAEIREAEGFEHSDFSTFEIESGAWQVGGDGREPKYVKGGSYPVSEKDGYFIIVLALE
jgi:hypothetical protein